MKEKILVTGSTSMVGTALVHKLWEQNRNVIPIDKYECDALHPEEIYECIRYYTPDIVILLAGVNGSLKWNIDYPYDIFTKSCQIGLNTIDACVRNKVGKVIFPISSCAYRPSEDISFEEDLFVDSPHESVACHGWAKRMINTCGDFARKQYGLNFVGVIAQNSFGPHDRFNERGKVISGLIKRFVDAKEKEEEKIFIYGDGSVKREFLYCKDFAEGLIQVMEKYNNPYPINLTSGIEISVGDLAKKIKKAVGYKGKIVFGDSSQNGQLRRRLSKERMDKYLNVKITPFDVALKETVDWYLSNRGINEN